MIHLKTFESFLYEYINKETLWDVERHLDRTFKKIGIDLVFTTHFYDRLNHERNKKDISTKELIDLFNATFKEYGHKFPNFGDQYAAVLTGINSDINIPFVLKYNPKSGDLNMVSKTIMRTSHFFSDEPKLKIKD